MDYIIFGTGAGASLVLSGWVLREMGPRARDRKPEPDDMLTASELVVRMAWARFCGACGMALLTCGLTVLTVTGITIFLAPDDETGGLALLVVFGLCGIMMLMWTALYLRQFGALGLVRPKPTVDAPPSGEPVPATRGREAVLVATDEPSIEEAAASRGGFGRFASFLRRDTAGDPQPPRSETPADPAPVISTPSVEPAEPSDGSSLPVGVEGAIGDVDEGDEKSLELDDPLVTSVPLPSRRHLAAEEPEPASESTGTGEDADMPAEAEAILTLRERRLRRSGEEPESS